MKVAVPGSWVAAVMPVAAGALLAGCAAGSSDASGDSGADACPLVVSDAWVKAADAGMTAAFGTITNTGDADEVLASATSPAAGRMEVHEVVDVDGAAVMRPKEGGLAVPAGASAALAPGGDHLMLLELPAPIEPGDEVTITVSCRDGGTASFTAVAKPFEGAAEDYRSEGTPAEPVDGGSGAQDGGSGAQDGGSGAQMDMAQSPSEE